MDFDDILRRILDTDPTTPGSEVRTLLARVWQALREGTLRAAEPRDGTWAVNRDVKEVILWAFRAGALVAHGGQGAFTYTDKDTMPLQRFAPDGGRRIVPGGTSVRDASYLAPGVIIMPPSYVNVGAYVDEGTLIDSHVLVGSCAQIGRNVHLSAAVQIGGVLEPSGALPVIVEDNVLIGGNCGVYEGTIVCRRAVLGTGVILNGSTPVYDLVREVVYRRTAEHPLVIPSNAVVVQGSRPARGTFADQHGIHLYSPVIVKYRDDRTDAATALEEALR
jgi:2,3,4,5-tetrahydropyridine-2-carboxylate N-succinyltransferase